MVGANSTGLFVGRLGHALLFNLLVHNEGFGERQYPGGRRPNRPLDLCQISRGIDQGLALAAVECGFRSNSDFDIVVTLTLEFIPDEVCELQDHVRSRRHLAAT